MVLPCGLSLLGSGCVQLPETPEGLLCISLMDSLLASVMAVGGECASNRGRWHPRFEAVESSGLGNRVPEHTPGQAF